MWRSNRWALFRLNWLQLHAKIAFKIAEKYIIGSVRRIQ